MCWTGLTEKVPHAEVYLSHLLQYSYLMCSFTLFAKVNAAVVVSDFNEEYVIFVLHTHSYSIIDSLYFSSTEFVTAFEKVQIENYRRLSYHAVSNSTVTN